MQYLSFIDKRRLGQETNKKNEIIITTEE